MNLVGPQPFDLAAPAQSARAAVGLWAAGRDLAHDAFPASDGRNPGVYLIVEDDVLHGFWLTFGERYLDDGPGPTRIPPFALALLEAATEEIWWERMKVAPVRGGTWNPIVVMEWPAALANRSAVAPPGVTVVDVESDLPATDDGLPTSWLDPIVPTGFEPELDVPEGPTARAMYPELTSQRSLLSIVRGTLTRRAGIHEGRFALAAPEPVEGSAILDMETWTRTLASKHVESPHTGPLALPGGRIGFVMQGWLAKDLELTPADITERLPGTLVARDIQSRFWLQLALASCITTLVLAGVLLFSGGMHLASLPNLQTAVALPPTHAQPAMSVCSADHGRFVEALRCEVRHLASGGTPGEADCSVPDPGDDLQPGYCGLADRSISGWVDENGYGYAELAAASACFRVLGTPWPYASPESNGTRPDPAKLLEDPQLRVSSLVELVGELDGACGIYRDKLEGRVSGAILSTHIGNGTNEGRGLRDSVFSVATAQMAPNERACWSNGRRSPRDEQTELLHVCGDDPAEAPLASRKAWQALAGDSETSVTARYVEARFGRSGTERGLWACHRALNDEVGGPPLKGLWDLALPQPRQYGGRGVSSQLVLDAGLTQLRSGQSEPSLCWEVVDRMIGAYAPAHPLLAAPPEDGWPSVEQQICGQACAVAYGLEPMKAGWVTPRTDLSVCVSSDAPAPPVEGRLDRLSLPWNQNYDADWKDPTIDEVCAFHLVAQGRLAVLDKGLSPPVWAGEREAGSGVAGGTSGTAVRSAEALGTYGRNRSTNTCSQVAAQCFAGELLTVLADGTKEPHEWRSAWRQSIAGIPRARLNDVRSPWCRLIRPYLQADGSLPEGEFDFPCALGVDQARTRLETDIQKLAAGGFTGSMP